MPACVVSPASSGREASARTSTTRTPPPGADATALGMKSFATSSWQIRTRSPDGAHRPGSQSRRGGIGKEPSAARAAGPAPASSTQARESTAGCNSSTCVPAVSGQPMPRPVPSAQSSRWSTSWASSVRRSAPSSGHVNTRSWPNRLSTAAAVASGGRAAASRSAAGSNNSCGVAR